MALSESQFHAIIDKVQKVYSPIIKELANKLVIHANWNDNSVNASFYRTKNKLQILAFGGLARNKFITEDGFTLVLCHELGHLLAGKPYLEVLNEDINYASAEGQSDFYATARCLKRVFAMDSNDLALKGLRIPKIVSHKCENSFTKILDQKICKRSAMASLDVARFFADLEGVAVPRFETPDELEVKITNTSYPSVQCRLDTLFNGALAKDINDKVDLRPACWFKPLE